MYVSDGVAVLMHPETFEQEEIDAATLASNADPRLLEIVPEGTQITVQVYKEKVVSQWVARSRWKITCPSMDADCLEFSITITYIMHSPPPPERMHCLSASLFEFRWFVFRIRTTRSRFPRRFLAKSWPRSRPWRATVTALRAIAQRSCTMG